ncbi:MAG: TlpA disulfide reductase family protein [Steroidobacteraceae bacterium]
MRSFVTTSRTVRGAHSRGATALAVLALALSAAPQAGAAPAVEVGATAPDFVLKATDGRNLRLAEYRGDVVVISFWASWCGGCEAALEALKGLPADPQGATPVVLAISLDGDARRVASAARSMDLGYPMLVDARQQVGRLYDVDALPYTLILDRDGVVIGAWTDAPAPRAEIERLAAEARP